MGRRVDAIIHRVIAGPLLLLLLSPIQPIHAAHQPIHEGVFQAAANDTLHLEALWPSRGLVRLFVSDRAGHALTPDRLQALHVRIIDGDHETAMHPGAGGETLEASISPEVAPPRTLMVVLTPPRRPDAHVSFAFDSFTGGQADQIVIPPTEIPHTRQAILDLLRLESRETQALLDGTSHRSVYLAVTRVRDLALALDAYVAVLPPATRTRAGTAIREAVRTSWLLHTSLDAGVPGQSLLGATMMREAIDEVLAAFGER